jgi:hypothetical protein
MNHQAVASKQTLVPSVLRTPTASFIGRTRFAGSVLIVAAATAVVGELGATLALIQAGAMAASRHGMDNAVGITAVVGLLGAGLCLRANEDEQVVREQAAGAESLNVA